MVGTIKEGLGEFNAFLSRVKEKIGDQVVQLIEQRLETEVDGWLHRGWHERRERVGKAGSGAVCGRCGSCEAGDFSRNGHRQRTLVTTFGVLRFGLPRVVCQCGGSVQLPFSIVEPYQRLWEDVLQQIARWADLGVSLRQMQEEIGQEIGTQVGLRKLNEVRHAVRLPAPVSFSSVAPVILLDAIHVPLLVDTDQSQKDRMGRQRVIKERKSVCILVALGLYPQSGRWGILDWQLADGESRAAWEGLLVRLETRGVYRERGVELFIHDGGQGLRSALEFIYPHLPHQRCLFHKLRNLWKAIQPPEDLSRKQSWQFKRDLMPDLIAIFHAPTLTDAEQLRDQFTRQWQDTQPDLIATLHRDWHESMAFHRVLDRFPHWTTTALRTTSLLERINRKLRRLLRPAGAWQSLTGLLATVARVLCPIRLI